MTFYKDGEYAELTSDKSVSFRRGIFGSLAKVDEGLAFTWNSNVVPPDDEIWYKTTDGKIAEINYSHGQPFNCEVISNNYDKGKGVIKLSGTITSVNSWIFFDNHTINEFLLPDSVSYLGRYAFMGCKKLTHFRVPLSFQDWGGGLFESSNIESFSGAHTSYDGKAIILDGTLIAVAGKGLTSYTIPNNVKAISHMAFNHCEELEAITIPEGVELIDDCAFDNCLSLRSVDFPESMMRLGMEAFRNCFSLVEFTGNSKFITEDHKCAIMTTSNGTTLLAATGDLVDYSIPEGINYIQGFVFSNSTNLERVTLPNSLSYISGWAFDGCNNLKGVYGYHTTDDHKGIVFDTVFDRLIVKNGVKKYTVPEGITHIGYMAFYMSQDLEEVILPDSVVELGGYDFDCCPELKKVVLSSNLKKVNHENPFYRSFNLQEIYFRSYLPPYYSDTLFYPFDHLTIYVPEETYRLYISSPQWSQFAQYMVAYKYDDLGDFNPDYYISSDYSKDGIVNEYKTHTKGNGVNLVVMGDGFSDRQIADGSYSTAIQKAIDAFFLEEPYKSYSDFFNVYSVCVVSSTEGYEHDGQALGTSFWGATGISGNTQKVVQYAQKAISKDQIDNALIIVIVNEDAHRGTCNLTYSQSHYGEYKRGVSIAYVANNGNIGTFNGTLAHEAGGHGFPALADEYVDYDEAISQETIDVYKDMFNYGFWKNIDFTSDPLQVKWAQFLSDERYAGEGLGCYEGGLTYQTGVWRPSENSIMRHNTGGFNAPSRYAIWYRIGKLAYGESWEGSYEDFVAYDAVNRTPAAVQKRQAQMRRQRLSKPLPPLAPPVVVGHSWREELQKGK